MTNRFINGLAASLILMSAPLVAQDAQEKAVPEQAEPKKQQDEKVMAALKKSLHDIKTMQAGFTMISPRGQRTSGQLSLQKPGFIRFDFGKDATQLYVSDGRILSVVDYEIGKVERVPVKDTPLRILLSEQLDFDGLNTRIQTSTGASGVQGTVALVVDDPKQQDMGQLILYFKPLAPQQDKPTGDMPTGDKPTGHNPTGDGDASKEDEIQSTPFGGYQLSYWAVRDGQGGVTYVTLQETVVNLALDKSLWTFKDPRGSAKRRRP